MDLCFPTVCPHALDRDRFKEVTAKFAALDPTVAPT